MKRLKYFVLFFVFISILLQSCVTVSIVNWAAGGLLPPTKQNSNRFCVKKLRPIKVEWDRESCKNVNLYLFRNPKYRPSIMTFPLIATSISADIVLYDYFSDLVDWDILLGLIVTPEAGMLLRFNYSIEDVATFKKFLYKYNKKYNKNYVYVFDNNYGFDVVDSVDFVNNYRVYCYNDFLFFKRIIPEKKREIDRIVLLNSDTCILEASKFIHYVNKNYPYSLNDVEKMLKKKYILESNNVKEFYERIDSFPNIVDCKEGYKFINNFDDVIQALNLYSNLKLDTTYKTIFLQYVDNLEKINTYTLIFPKEKTNLKVIDLAKSKITNLNDVKLYIQIFGDGYKDEVIDLAKSKINDLNDVKFCLQIFGDGYKDEVIDLAKSKITNLNDVKLYIQIFGDGYKDEVIDLAKSKINDFNDVKLYIQIFSNSKNNIKNRALELITTNDDIQCFSKLYNVSSEKIVKQVYKQLNYQDLYDVIKNNTNLRDVFLLKRRYIMLVPSSEIKNALSEFPELKNDNKVLNYINGNYQYYISSLQNLHCYTNDNLNNLAQSAMDYAISDFQKNKINTIISDKKFTCHLGKKYDIHNNIYTQDVYVVRGGDYAEKKLIGALTVGYGDMEYHFTLMIGFFIGSGNYETNLTSIFYGDDDNYYNVYSYSEAINNLFNHFSKRIKYCE